MIKLDRLVLNVSNIFQLLKKIAGLAFVKFLNKKVGKCLDAKIIQIKLINTCKDIIKVKLDIYLTIMQS